MSAKSLVGLPVEILLHIFSFLIHRPDICSWLHIARELKNAYDLYRKSSADAYRNKYNIVLRIKRTEILSLTDPIQESGGADLLRAVLVTHLPNCRTAVELGDSISEHYRSCGENQRELSTIELVHQYCGSDFVKFSQELPSRLLELYAKKDQKREAIQMTKEIVADYRQNGSALSAPVLQSWLQRLVDLYEKNSQEREAIQMTEEIVADYRQDGSPLNAPVLQSWLQRLVDLYEKNSQEREAIQMTEEIVANYPQNGSH